MLYFVIFAMIIAIAVISAIGLAFWAGFSVVGIEAFMHPKVVIRIVCAVIAIIAALGLTGTVDWADVILDAFDALLNLLGSAIWALLNVRI